MCDPRRSHSLTRRIGGRLTARGGVGRRAGAIIVVRGTVVVRVVVAPVGIAAGGWEKGREEGWMDG